MNVMKAPLRELGAYEDIGKLLAKKHKLLLTGCVDAQKLHIISGIGDGYQMKIIATYSEQKAKELYEDYSFYDKNTYLYPAKDLIFYQADIRSNQLVQQRMKAIRKILEGRGCTIITTFDTLMSPQIPLSTYRDYVITIEKEGCVDESELAEQLVAMGYEKSYQVESPGQFSIRGDIIDIFDLTEENPVRIQLWGDEVESIRSFDLLSQRSIESLEDFVVYPATEIILDEESLEEGFARIEKECEKVYETLRKEFKTEEAHRIRTLSEL